MLYFTKNKYDCTGCGACKVVCSVDCISFDSDEEGFFSVVGCPRDDNIW